MMEDKINEIKKFWSYNGESSQINDIVSIREMACTDIDVLIGIINNQMQELDAWRSEFMM